MTARSGEWKPLLEGAIASAARAAIEAISDDLRALPVQPEGFSTPWTHSLSSGTAGWALFHAYRGLVRTDAGDDERAMELVAAALDAVAAQPMDDSLFHGLPGLAWTVEHLGRHFYELGEIDPLAAIDGHVLSQIDVTRRRRGFELMRGVVGHGVYALERMPRPSARTILSAVITALEVTATQTDDGIAWFTPPEHLGPDVAFAPEGYFNLGLAHGVTGVIPFLARCVAAGVDVDRAMRMLDGAVAWLRAQARDGDAGPNVFPAFVMPQTTRAAVRSGWCYGDIGLACALAVAGQLAERPAWTAAARETALRVATAPFDTLGIEDAGLCHGACGTGHLFNRMYQTTGDLTFAAAARTCFARGLAMRTSEAGAGGFRELDLEAAGGRSVSPGLLGGAAGIGLVLLAAVSDQAPSWDAVFLVGTA